MAASEEQSSDSGKDAETELHLFKRSHFFVYLPEHGRYHQLQLQLSQVRFCCSSKG